MKPRKHAELIKAWADGAEIEYRMSDGHWEPAESPLWWDGAIYRIKPQLVTVWDWFLQFPSGNLMRLDWKTEEEAQGYVTRGVVALVQKIDFTERQIKAPTKHHIDVYC